MTYCLDDKWIWDFWYILDGGDYHFFYLQAPRSLADPNLRHSNATIGHAVTQDLLHWETLPDALMPSSHEDAWDDFATWTGSIIKEANTWFMFYTGTNRGEKGLIQRIGLALSYDLVHWKRYSEHPIIMIDARWYELLNLDLWHEQAWRDPWVFKYNNLFHALITSRANYGHKSSRGVIGYASSPDLINWDVHAPITEPGEFGYMEVPQIARIVDSWYLFFSVDHEKYSNARLERSHIKRQSGTHYMVADNPFGPFKYLSDDFLVGDELGTLYSGKVIQKPDREWAFMACRQFESDNNFAGKLISPIPITVLPDGKISILSNPFDVNQEKYLNER